MKKIFLYICLVFCTITSNAQFGGYEHFRNTLDAFNEQYLPEKIFVHTDKNAYLAGEILWYKLYYVDGYTHRPLQLSRVAYVELIDQQLQSIYKAKVSLDLSESNGSIHLPLHLGSGIYQLKVYTNYMKNFGEKLFFEKEIAIYNTFSNDTAAVVNIKNDVALNLYPEGGSIIYGLENSIAYQFVNEIGNGIKNEIWLTRNAKDTLLNIKSNEWGMGKFVFTPNPSDQYHIITKYDNGKTLLTPIRGIEQTGSNLQLMDNGVDVVEVLYRSNAENPNFRSRLVHLLVTSNRIPVIEKTINLQNDVAKFSIDRNDLKDGINVITLLNDFGKPLAERLFFKLPKDNISFLIETNKTSLESRELLEIGITSSKAKAVNSSMSIYRIDSLFNVDESDIFNYFWLTSELKGVVERPREYFNNENPSQLNNLDLLMMVKGWRRFDWKDMELKEVTHVPEIVGQIVKGKLINKITKEAIPKTMISYSIPNRSYRFGVAVTDSVGGFSFILKDIYGINELYLQTNSLVDKNYEFRIEENFVEKHVSPFSKKFSYTTVNNLEQLSEYHISNQVNNIYNADRIRDYKVLKATDTFPFFQKPMYSYILDNYVRFNSFEEVLREYVSPVMVYQKDKKLNISLINTVYKDVHRENVLVMIDGLELLDPSVVFSLDPHRFEKIDIISRAFSHGAGYYNGIINFKSYNGDLGGLTVPEYVNVFNYDGLQKYRTFFNPNYQTKEAMESRLPDFRHTLYWNANINISEGATQKIEVYTSDLKGKYIGVIHGIDTEGKIGSQQFFFEVK